MASIYKEARLSAPIEKVWGIVADVGRVNRLTSLITESRLEGDRRYCRFGDSNDVEELIVSVDEANKRVVYSVQRSSLNFTHHNASMQVVPDGRGTRFLWITDLTPDEAAAQVEPVIDMVLASIKETLG